MRGVDGVPGGAQFRAPPVRSPTLLAYKPPDAAQGMPPMAAMELR